MNSTVTQLQNKSMWRVVIIQHLKWFGKE